MGRPDYTHVDFSSCKTLSHTNAQSSFMTTWKVDTSPFAVEKTKTQWTLSWSDRVWERPPVSPSGSSSWVELETKWTTKLGQKEIKALLISIRFFPKILEESELYNLIAPNFGAVSEGRSQCRCQKQIKADDSIPKYNPYDSSSQDYHQSCDLHEPW